MGIHSKLKTFTGTNRGDTINGTAGRDIVIALGGDDFISTGAGNDLILAGNGNDLIDAGTGYDTVAGGSGFDTVIYGGSFRDYDFGRVNRFSDNFFRVDGNGSHHTLLGVEALSFDDATVYLDGRNNAPIAAGDAKDAVLGQTVFSAAGLAANDIDFDGDSLTVTAVSATSAAGAAVSLNGGQVTYNAAGLFTALAAGETAEDTFTYTVSDGKGGSDQATVTVTVTGENDAPEITSAASATILENGTAVLTVTAADPDNGAVLCYSIAVGADSVLFAIDESTGALSFVSTPDHENPADAGGDNIYDVTVAVTDGLLTDTQDVAVTVEDDNTETFTLELLHFSDQEASTGAIQDAPNLSAVLNALRAQDVGNDGLADNSLTLSSGDTIIPSVFFNASLPVFGSAGIADIQIQNELGIQASALGNHEFDFGPGVLAGLISGSAPGSILGTDFQGALYPYLSTNLDFSTNTNLAPLEVAGGGSPLANTVTSSVVLQSGGELIGVVGATTPTLDFISSPGTVGVNPTEFFSNPTPEQLDQLVALIQAEVDAVLAANPSMNKVILLAHMQQLNIELELATRLENVDIIMAGGSNTRLFDDNDTPRAGDSDQGQYPLVVTNAGGTDTLVVNTDGSYKYVGRLVIDFDEDGNILADSYDQEVSGAYATDDAGVAALGAEGLVDPEIQQIADAIEAQIIATESNVFGLSDVFLNGNRAGTADPASPDGVRTQETNLGNLTADANLAYANQFATAIGETAPVLVSIKNGGGIRASIGEVIVPPGGTAAIRGPNAAILDGDGNVIKPEGGISQNDIATTLAFNNGLSLLTLTKQQLVAVLEHGVSANAAAGQFPQFSGVQFSYDPDLPAGSRILNAEIVDEAGDSVMVLVRDGVIEGDPATEIRIVTLNFLAAGGDGYPFPVGPQTNRVDLYDLDGNGVADGSLTGDATFATDGTEQDAFAEYLNDNFLVTPYSETDTGRDGDTRIQNLNFTEDTVIDDPVVVITINEIDADTPGTDITEFVELYDGGAGNTSLDGYVAVFYNGSNDLSYAAFDLDGFTTDANGFFVIGNAGVASVDLVFASNTLQNGADAVAIFQGNAADFPNNSPLTTANLVDAVVYDTADADDTGLLVGLGETVQYDENANSAGAGESVSAVPDGSGSYVAQAPTPGTSNVAVPPAQKFISEIQGTTTASLLAGTNVTVSAIVTYTVANGFFIQEEAGDYDANAATSEGVFVFTGSAPAVAVGDLAEVTGTVTEFNSLTELTGVAINVISSGHALPDYTDIVLPRASANVFETVEGMLVSLSSSTAEPIIVTQNFNLDRFGEITVSSGTLTQPTQLFDAQTQAADVAALAAANALNGLVIDDGVSGQNPDAFPYLPNTTAGDDGDGIVDNGDTFGPEGATLRLGAEMSGPIVGVMTEQFGDYAMLVNTPLPVDETTNGGARPQTPDDVLGADGSVVVSSFNVLNYFTTLGSRGAQSAIDFERQTDKIVNAMLEIKADVFGLQEIENNGFGSGSAIQTLLDALNAEAALRGIAAVYAFVDPIGVGGQIGTDEITTGLIYNTLTMQAGGSDVLVYSDGASQLNRPAVAATFTEIASGESFNVAVNHLKSKGASGLTDTSNPDYDQGDGQGFWNATRANATQQLTDWLATDPTGSGDIDYLILGDLNSYAEEDPIQLLEAAGYVNLVDQFIGNGSAYSFVFDGQQGNLDHGLASASLAAQVTGVTEWHINADEPDLLSYSSEFKDSAFFSDDVFGASDHDPLILGLKLGAPAETLLV
ncbi:MAG: ExeM/NucH family extracellular endonuclease [Aestuariivirga sp.]